MGNFAKVSVFVYYTGEHYAPNHCRQQGAGQPRRTDLVGVRGAVENYDKQVLCMGQNVIAAPEAWVLVDVWLDARHNTAGSYAPKLVEIAAFEGGEPFAAD